MKIRNLAILIFLLFFVWYIPLVFETGLIRYGLEELRVAVVFFLFGWLLCYIYYAMHKGDE